MTSHFDFRGIASFNNKIKILHADEHELCVRHVKEDRTYYITSPEQGRFALEYTSELQRDRKFVCNVYGIATILQYVDLLSVDNRKKFQLDLYQNNLVQNNFNERTVLCQKPSLPMKRKKCRKLPRLW